MAESVVKSLPTLRARASAETIQEAETLLAGARSGEFQSMVVIAFRADGTYLTAVTSFPDVLRVVGAIEQIKFEVQLSHHAQAVE